MTPPSFTFRLERVRSLREREEDLAREEFARGLQHQLQGEALLRAADHALSAAREHALGAATAPGGTSAADLMAAQVWLERTRHGKHAAELDLSRRQAEVGHRRDVLAARAQDRQAIEKLRERDFEAHRRTAARIEQNALDEMALAVHRRGVAA